MSYINDHTFAKAVRFIYDNIDKPIELKDLATNIGISVSSLKRLFEEALDQSPGTFIRKLRLEMAFRTLKSRDENILEIALSHGFEDQSAFARQFKKTFGYSPTQARKKLNIVNELECITLEEPDIIEINYFNIQSVTEKGLYFECAPRAWQKLKSALSEEIFNDDFSGLFIGIGHDNPHEGEVKEDQVRFTAGIALLEKDLALDDMKIAGGQYARFRYQGKPVNLGMAYHYIYGKWQESSNNKIMQTIPAFVTYEHFPTGFKQEYALIYVPLLISPEA